MVDDRLPGKKKLSISALFFPVLKSGSQKLSKDLLKWHPFPSTIFTFFVRPQFSWSGLLKKYVLVHKEVFYKSLVQVTNVHILAQNSHMAWAGPLNFDKFWGETQNSYLARTIELWKLLKGKHNYGVTVHPCPCQYHKGWRCLTMICECSPSTTVFIAQVLDHWPRLL